MSRTQPTDTEWAEMLFACPSCGAARGQWCATFRTHRAGRPAKWLHSARWSAVREVVRLSGWQAWVEEEQANARRFRLEAQSLAGALVALQGELAQIVTRFPNNLVAPQPLVDRIAKILATAKETSS